jgi:hypothetical protein
MRALQVGLRFSLFVAPSRYHVSRLSLPALIRRDICPQPNPERVAQSHTRRHPWEPRRKGVAIPTSCVPPWKSSFLGLFPVIVAQALPHVFYPIKDNLSSQPTKTHITDFSLSSNRSDTNPVAVLTFTYSTDAATMPSGTLHRRLVASIICGRASFFLDEEQEPYCWFSNRPCCLSTIRGKVNCVRGLTGFA